MSSHNIGKDEILQIAHLARVELKADAVESLQSDLNNILGYVHSLQKLDLAQVKPTTHGSLIPTPLREDQVQPSLPIEEALSAAPQHGESAFVVPKVVG